MLRLVFWIFVLILALSYFGISIREIVNSPAGQANIAYVVHLLSQVWQSTQAWLRTLQMGV